MTIHYRGTGRRKESTARVYLSAGAGQMTINGRTFEDYFPRKTLRLIVRQPLELTENAEKFDIHVRVAGGGLTGQAGAIRHGVSRALVVFNDGLKPVLRRAGFLTRDARAVERKKYGRPKARKRFQFSKR